ncbi:MAG: SpoIIIAH-like family protein [Lachnospiraceae bacterium]|nr:SpoIIIAH-like family protein [Lachnospiraceae bacterium]
MKKLWKRNQIMITALALMIAIAGYLNFMGKKVDEEDLFTTSAQFEEMQAADVSDATDVTGGDQLADMTGDADIDLAQVGDVTSDELALITDGAQELDASAALTDIDSMDSEEEMLYSDYLDEEQVENITAAVTEDYDGETPGEAVFTSTTAITSLEGANILREQTRAKNKEALMEIINSDNLPDSAKQEAVESMIALTDISQKECSAEILLEAKGFEDVVVSITGETADVIVAATELSDAQRAQIEDIVKRKTGISAEHIIISPVAEK